MERIHLMKLFFESNIDYTLFWTIIHNIGNGPTRRNPQDWESLTIDEWVEFYASYKINISNSQLKLIFDYILRYFPNIIRMTSKDTYKSIVRNNLSESDDFFTLEKISLFSFSIIN
ncbi:MAG: hypothetical protein JXR05_11390 [Flavobacteriaceae bacterium]